MFHAAQSHQFQRHMNKIMIHPAHTENEYEIRL